LTDDTLKVGGGEGRAEARPSRWRVPRLQVEAGLPRLLVLLAVLVCVGGALALANGWLEVGQVTVNGIVAGSYLALGAIGLTLVYGVLRLVNFAHGDMLTFGAYIALLVNVHYGMPFLAAVVLAIAATSLLGVVFELTLWRPMRGRGAALPQLLLITVGLAFLIRNGIQLVAGSEGRTFNIDVITTYEFAGLRIGRVQLIDVVVGVATLTVVGLAIRYTKLGKEMRAVSDDPVLAEVAGIDTGRIAVATWILGAGLAALAGVLYASAIGSMTPNLGYSLILALFASAVLGGVGSAYGALVGGFVLGLSQEWSTLVFDARWKPAIGFALLVLTLLVWPQGIFGRRRTV
jgi:branched-chain amino acid transport system permease protein